MLQKITNGFDDVAEWISALDLERTAAFDDVSESA